jgi:predicted PP-loop superfamily ATPase
VIDINIHHYVHMSDPVTDVVGKIDTILDVVQKLLAKEEVMSQELDTLRAAVAATAEVDKSAIELIKGLADKIEALKADPVELQALADQLRVNTDSLAQAVSTYTPPA